MGYFSSIRHSDKTPDKADRIKAILDKGIPKPKHFDAPKAKHEALKEKLSPREKSHRALIMSGKRIVGDKTPPYWLKQQEK